MEGISTKRHGPEREGYPHSRGLVEDIFFMKQARHLTFWKSLPAALVVHEVVRDHGLNTWVLTLGLIPWLRVGPTGRSRKPFE
jgi:hypothetical protein